VVGLKRLEFAISDQVTCIVFIIHCMRKEGTVGYRIKYQVTFCELSVYWYYFVCLHSCTVFPVLPRHFGLEFSIPPSYSGGAGLESDWHCSPGNTVIHLGAHYI